MMNKVIYIHLANSQNVTKKMKINKVKLGNRVISKKSLPYIIAEIGVNHECSMKKAKD